MEPNTPNEALARAISKWPSLKAFAGQLGAPYQRVQQWLKNGVPAAYCPRIEELTGGECKCEDLNNTVNWSYLRGTQASLSHTRRATDLTPDPGRCGRQPASPHNILDTVPDGAVVVPTPGANP
ncbi:MAG: helix-turn-helix domain-containing protein [Burkholderiaceae bacterium]|nr:helix-turn-helix domain-containing protein [Burkholderiaceae bacterium]